MLLAKCKMFSIRASVILSALAMLLHASQAMRATRLLSEGMDKDDEQNIAKMKKQLRTEITYLVHSDFYVNAWTGSGYSCLPDGVLHVQHNADMRPQIIVRRDAVSIKYPFNTKVMLQSNVFGFMSGEVLCQVVGPARARYTTCVSDLGLSLRHHDNRMFKGFQLDPIVFENVRILSTRFGYPTSHMYSKVEMRVGQKGPDAKGVDADFVLTARTSYKHTLWTSKSKHTYKVGTGTRQNQMRSISMDDRKFVCLELAIGGSVYILCPSSNVTLTNESSVEDYFAAFPQGKELLWQLCLVGAPSILPDLGFDICSHMKNLHRVVTHDIIWQDSSMLDNLFFNGPTRGLRVNLIDKSSPPIKTRELDVTDCSELDDHVDTLLSGLDFAYVGSERRLQLLQDTNIVNAGGQPFFETCSLPARGAHHSAAVGDTPLTAQDQDTAIERAEEHVTSSISMPNSLSQLLMDHVEVSSIQTRL